MNKTNTGGSAFPVVGDIYQIKATGMTLRDYFAAKAMQGIMQGQYPITKELDAEQRIAVAAYQLADAMLKAREE